MHSQVNSKPEQTLLQKFLRDLQQRCLGLFHPKQASQFIIKPNLLKQDGTGLRLKINPQFREENYEKKS